MRKRFLITLMLIIISLLFAACSQKPKFKIDYQKYKLKNGLTVIIHEDHSDPIASVAVVYHVGSNREKVGKTGFAHLFEHMMFQESQDVGQDQFFKKIQEAGGTLNGFTFKDGTGYYEIVPNNALEMALWLESDRMGFLLSTVTQEAFINQQDVVQNEKRQSYDNRPYGQTRYVIDKLLYPPSHPYNWQVIGSMEDLSNASLKDVHDFHEKWYIPNNATLVVAGDFDLKQAKEWIEKYFGEIQRGKDVTDMKPVPVTLSETKRAYHEDNFAKSPELNMVFPTVEQYNKDSYALDLMGSLISDGKKAPLYKVIVEEEKLAPSVSAYQNSGEIAGSFKIRVRAFPKKKLSDVEKAIKKAFKMFEEKKFTEKDLDRIKAKTETRFYNGISSILGKSFQLAFYDEFAGSPDFISQDLQNKLNVTSGDIWRVYNKYIKDKNFVLTSFVPKGEVELAAENSELFPIKEESITKAQKNIAKNNGFKVEKIPTKFDRSIEPKKGPDPVLKNLDIWQTKLSNGIKVNGIKNSELPLVQFSITLRGGMVLDDPKKIGAANLMTDIMMEGTKNKTPLELEEAIDELGSSISMYTTKEAIVLNGNCLASKFNETFSLAKEILLEPRWDKKEFERIKKETIEIINRQSFNPSAIASNVFNKLVYGKDNILSNSTLGTKESVKSTSVEDLKNYYAKNFSPSVTSINVVGDVSENNAISVFKELENWQAKTVDFPELKMPEAHEKATLCFVDFPNAKQSQIRIGNLGLAFNDLDYYKAVVMNYKLGGSFNGILNMILREEKGYTYGARSGFYGTEYPGKFTASSAVRSNTTLESVKIFRDEIKKYREGISDEDMEFTKHALIKSNARRFETLGALLRMLNQISRYELPTDYIKRQEKIIKSMTTEEHKALAQQYLHPDRMYYLVVGDAATQFGPLKKLGFDEVYLLDKDGNIVK